MSWYKDWFDSPLYELLYAYRNEEEANKLADLIEQRIPREEYPKILDVGCGRGRHSISLAERGYHVTGFDLSPQAIKKAQAIARKRNLRNVSFVVNDMRNPLPDTFDAALNLFTTFGYFMVENQNIEVLKNVRTMLKKNGLFLIDFMNAKKVERELVPSESGEHNGIQYSITRYIEDGFVYKIIRFDGGHNHSPKEYTERVQLFDKNWFAENLTSSGFEPLNVWGDYNGGSFDVQHSPRLIILSKAV
ncbi:class I SAM-dependent methyltransferase [Rhodohalobacter sp. SW132]|uniref:class I SAM-dependent methyltransferase n=1 Tax=Rhodohalobacter sp. SW132 TaxID=2293433 RepID=UPI000E271F44|nr:class I SAM-dependent methyltransferase [Rhodohalobacter sp. SW132]REL29204.1 class I SAM-dependent methyltransferase [Rhodohalobacter sp. SW132]